jgi:hypothetical protein
VSQWGVKNINATNPSDVFIIFFLVKFAVLFSTNRAGGAGSRDPRYCLTWKSIYVGQNEGLPEIR